MVAEDSYEKYAHSCGALSGIFFTSFTHIGWVEKSHFKHQFLIAAVCDEEDQSDFPMSGIVS